jgi:hypothetical protein
MIKRLSLGFRVAMLAWLPFCAAQAAMLEAIQGQVMVNTGNGYRFVSGTVELKPGDMVIANSGGAAQLAYDDGCSVQVQAGSVVTVGPQSPCAANQANSGNASLGLTPGTLAVGAVVVGGGVGAAMLLGGSNGDKPASP